MKLRLFKRSVPVSGSLFGSLFDYLVALEATSRRQLRLPAATDVILDVGASIGFFAVAVALHFPWIKVYAVEPAPQNYRYMLWNIRENNVTGRVWPVNAALWGAGSDSAALELRYSPVWPIVSSVCPGAPESECDFVEYSTPALTLMDLLAMLGLDRIRWLKMDCEGCEWRVFADPATLRWLRSGIPLVTAELHPDEAPMSDGAAEVVRTLCSPGSLQSALLWNIMLKSAGVAAQGPFPAQSCSISFDPMPDAAMRLAMPVRETALPLAELVVGTGSTQALPAVPSPLPLQLPVVPPKPPLGPSSSLGELLTPLTQLELPPTAAALLPAPWVVAMPAVAPQPAPPLAEAPLSEPPLAPEVPVSPPAAVAVLPAPVEPARSLVPAPSSVPQPASPPPPPLAPLPVLGPLPAALPVLSRSPPSRTPVDACPAPTGIAPLPLGGDAQQSLRSGGRVFLLSSFSHDDTDQWPLIPHFVTHYRDRLGVRPELFLLILHSDSQNTSGITRMGRVLRRRYGVVHFTPVIEPYSSLLHFRIKVEILHRHVSKLDWVMQVDADEFVFFPGNLRAHEALNRLDIAGENVHYGLMVDRVAANGDVDRAPLHGTPIFAQYPLNCAVTLLAQSSDVRKASAYRAYLRTTTGNHNVLGLNESAAARTLSPMAAASLVADLRRFLGDTLFQQMPYAKMEKMPAVRPTAPFATVYHFKFLRGLTAKLKRRAETEDYTRGQYWGLRASLERDNRFGQAALGKLCNARDLPGPADPIRALTTRELIQLFLNIRPEHVDLMLREQLGLLASEYEPYLTRLLQTNIHSCIARESHLPVH